MPIRTHIFPCKRYYWYSDSPVANWLEDFSDWLKASNYSESTRRGHIAVLRFSLEPHAPIAHDRCFSQAQLESIVVNAHRPKHFANTRYAFGLFLRARDQFLEPPPQCHHPNLVEAYCTHLREIRGLAPETIRLRKHTARIFLNTALSAGQSTMDLSVGDVEHFVSDRAMMLTRASLKTDTSSLRGFLRYCVDSGLAPAGIEEFDRPRLYRYEQLPRALPWPLVEQLLESIDRSTPTGMRDHAVFYFMAHYGLRPSEITLLPLDSIDWYARTISVTQVKTRSKLILPLTEPVADILQSYIRGGRPTDRGSSLFPRSRAPSGAITRRAIAEAFRRRVKESGIDWDGTAPYALRHSFALRLLDGQVGIKAIGDLLGHRNIDTTGGYLRLHIEALRDVALPLMGESHEDI